VLQVVEQRMRGSGRRRVPGLDGTGERRRVLPHARGVAKILVQAGFDHLPHTAKGTPDRRALAAMATKDAGPPVPVLTDAQLKALTGNAGGNPQLRVQNTSGGSNAFGVLGRITSGSPSAQSAVRPT